MCFAQKVTATYFLRPNWPTSVGPPVLRKDIAWIDYIQTGQPRKT